MEPTSVPPVKRMRLESMEARSKESTHRYSVPLVWGRSGCTLSILIMVQLASVFSFLVRPGEKPVMCVWGGRGAYKAFYAPGLDGR